MCRIPRVLIVAPADRHLELRKTLSSLEYDVTAAVATPEDADGITADVAVVLEPDAATLDRLSALGFKTAALGGDGAAADLAVDDAASFKARIWELFRPR